MAALRPLRSLAIRLEPHRPFLFLLALFATFRTFALVLFSPADRIEPFSDFRIYLEQARLSDFDLYPYLDFWSEYPPLFPWLATGLYRLVRSVPVWGPVQDVLWFRMALSSVLLVADILIVVLVYRLALHLHGRRGAYQRALLYAFLVLPVFATMVWFDALPTAALLLSLWLLVTHRWAWSGVAAAIGAALKGFPLVVLPVALRLALAQGERRPLLSVLLPTVAVLLVLLGPLLVLSPEMTLASLTGPLRRSSWETLGALLEGYFGVGAAGGNRFIAAEAGLPAHEARLPWAVVTLAMAALMLGALRQRLASVPVAPVALTALLLHLVVLGSKGWSPQFLVWLLPLLVLLLQPARAFLYSLLLTLLNVIEAPLYLFLFPDAPWLLAYTVLGRTLLLGVLAVEYAGLAFGWNRLVSRLKLAPHVASAVVGLSLLSLLPALGASYHRSRLDDSPYAREIDLLRSLVAPGEVVLIENGPAYGQMLPFLRDHAPTHPAGWPDGAPGLEAYLSRRTAAAQGVWLCGADPSIQAALDGRFLRLASFHAGACLLTHWLRDTGVYTLLEEPVRLDDFGKLVGYRWSISPSGSEADLRLLWLEELPADFDYSVFVHVLDAGGALAAQSDAGPCRGLCRTSAWSPGDLVEDVHRVDLPPGVEPVSIAVGMYRWDTLERVPLHQAGRWLPDDRLLIPLRK